MRSTRLLTVTLFLLTLSGSTLAQSLDGQWFKATATAKGASFDVEGFDPGGILVANKASFKKITHYIQVFQDEGISSQSYAAVIWVQDAEGNWFPFSGGDLEFGDAALTWVADGELTFYVAESLILDDAEGGKGLQGFDVFFNGPAKVKFNGGELKSAKIKSAGAIAEGSFTGMGPFSGGAKVNLTRVPESKLPFELIKPVTEVGPGTAHPGGQPAWREAEPVGPQLPAGQEG